MQLDKILSAAEAWELLGTRTDLTDDELEAAFAAARPIINDDALLVELLSEMAE